MHWYAKDKQSKNAHMRETLGLAPKCAAKSQGRKFDKHELSELYPTEEVEQVTEVMNALQGSMIPSSDRGGMHIEAQRSWYEKIARPRE
ncbi:hypothetical protein Tco_0978021 [Tanacetum coccineum]|uniref:Uncharacterized protein n=1 Tax=Tanacetum coccineum TaxID=301880 RepID=A0ABQ5ELV7_9ASTR